MKTKHYSEELILACLRYTSQTEIAKATGKQRQTIGRYLKDTEFQRILTERRNLMTKGALDYMKSELENTARTIIEIRDNEDASYQTRLNACQLHMTFSQRWTETLEIEERLRILEESI